VNFSSDLIAHRLSHVESTARASLFAPAVRDKIVRYGAPIGCLIEHHQRLGRCMHRISDIFLDYETEGKVPLSGTVVIADALENGSGRFDRSWHAPEGGLWLALALADTFIPEISRLLPFVAGIACCETIREMGVRASLKWVNDLCFQNKKIAGVLCETMKSPVYGDKYFVIGIGININNQQFPVELNGTAECLRGFSGEKANVTDVAYRLLGKLGWNIGLLHYQEECLLKVGDQIWENFILKRWLELSDTVGRRVCYGFDVQKKPLYRAVVKEVNEEGGLVMLLEDGTCITEYAGEIIYIDDAS